MRILFLGAALTFIVLFGALTLWAIATNGIDATGVLALFILVMIGIGVYGASQNPPDA